MVQSAAEKRIAPRRTTMSESVATVGGKACFECSILDINAYGARVHIEGHDAPEVFYLIDLTFSIAYKAKIQWRKPPFVGTRFLETWNLASAVTPDWLKSLHLEGLMTEARTGRLRPILLEA